ncbi:hypothetical protein LZ190_23305, partial [Rhodovulum sulfidophilum]|nr:hypothetical protein [Rhodovulum sulfidophilum]
SDRDTLEQVMLGLWSGDEDIQITVPLPEGGTQSRTYIGGCGLSVSGLQYVGDLSDQPVTVTMSQIADAAQQLVRGYDVRMAECEIHATSMRGGVFVSAPQVMWVGIVDEGPISTPGVGGEGGISLTVRDELLVQLSAVNPATSSNAHQRGRNASDDFCKYASTVSSREVQWYKP